MNKHVTGKTSDESQPTHKTDNQVKPNSTDRFPIVAIGASAGGLEAYDQFFSRIPAKTGMAYVVITHLDRDHISIMSDLLKRYTPMTVVTIIDGVLVKSDTIYVIPPRKNVSIKNGVLNLVEQTEPHYSNLPINFFFRSLATDRADTAVAIILSGAGTDGSLGARDIKLNSGLVIAQDPATAKFDSMPANVINTGFVDYILPPDLIPGQLNKWLNESCIKDETNSAELSNIFSLIKSKTRYDFSSYKLTTIRRRIEKQMQIHSTSTLPEYINVLKQHPNAVEDLFRDFLIGVTRFFRDPDIFEILKKKCIAKVLTKKPLNYNLRVWVPGCSSGEEVYTIAMLIAEHMQESNQHLYIQIFGTDIDSNALSIARNGVYPKSIEADVSPERLNRFFTHDKNGYKVTKEIRSMVIFGEQNLIKDPPFTKVDIISCRNLLIYLNVKLQKKIIPMFHYSLKPDGMLLLGSSESIGSNIELFNAIDKKAKIFECKHSTGSKRILFNFPETAQSDQFSIHLIKERFLLNQNSASEIAIKNLLLDQYISPCIVVNRDSEIIYMNLAVNIYIRSLPLSDNLNITEVVHHDLKMILKSALHTAISKNTAVEYHGLPVTINKITKAVNLKVIPIHGIDDLNGHFFVMLEEDRTDANSNLTTAEHGERLDIDNSLVKKLERELSNTKENLQATIEELESSNEELQSLNEELQSTNEELETSKEELHSLNEELVITNTELQSRIDQLATIHDDMANLFNSTEIATFFLDNNLCIKRFTPKAQEFIHLIPADIGRSISHFATNIKYDKLMDDAREVLRTLNQKSIEVQGKSNRWFLIRILPYRTMANMIDGVIITLNDITDHKESEKKLNKLNSALNNALSLSKSILDTVMIPLMVLSIDLKIISANRAYYKSFHLLPEDVIGVYIYNVKHWDIPELRELLSSDFPSDTLLEGIEIKANIKSHAREKLTINLRKIPNNDNGESVILLAIGPQ